MEYKTKQYTRDAIKRYREKSKELHTNIPLELWERMQRVGLDAYDLKGMIEKEVQYREQTCQYGTKEPKEKRGERIHIYLPEGTKDMIKMFLGSESLNGYINNLIEGELNERGV